MNAGSVTLYYNLASGDEMSKENLGNFDIALIFPASRMSKFCARNVNLGEIFGQFCGLSRICDGPRHKELRFAIAGRGGGARLNSDS
jgi:hypothetical protein